MYVLRPGLPISMQQRTRVAGILGLQFTAALPHDAAQHLLFTHNVLGTRPAPLCPPPGHKEGYSVICSVYTVEKS
eukprot:1139057-Pelagomonas_calceolata.AAC.2